MKRLRKCLSLFFALLGVAAFWLAIWLIITRPLTPLPTAAFVAPGLCAMLAIFTWPTDS